jgi:hypothetical protein
MEDKVHKYRLDFYYQSLVIYLIFFALYVLVRGSVEKNFKVIFDDPIFYILLIFISIFLVVVIMNIIRSPMIILKDDRMILKNRFGSREVMFSDIIHVRIGRKRRSGDDAHYRIIKLKLKHRRRQFRIRANDFERGGELIKDFLKIKQNQQTVDKV